MLANSSVSRQKLSTFSRYRQFSEFYQNNLQIQANNGSRKMVNKKYVHKRENTTNLPITGYIYKRKI